MSTSFVIEGWRLRIGDGTVRLFQSDSSGARVEILRTIGLQSDDPHGASKYFNWHETYAEDCLYAHMIDQLLSPAATLELGVALHATLEYVSKLLAIGSELGNVDLAGDTIIMTAESLIQRLKDQQRADGSYFRVFSGLDRIPSMTSSIRAEIKEKITTYLKELQSLPSVIKKVQDEIDQNGTAF
jgi:hypothetical protein